MLDNRDRIVYPRFRRAAVEKLLMMTVFVVFLRPAYLGSIPAVNRLWTVAQMGAMLAAVVMASVNRLSRHTLLVAAYCGLFFISTIINGVPVMDTVREIMPYAGLAVVCDLWMRAGRARPMLISLCWVLVAYVYINLASVLLFPQGLYTSVTSDGISRVKCWFLGYKNPQIRFLLPALTLLVVVKWNGRKQCISVLFVLTALAVLVTVILVDSATSILVTIGFVGLLILFRKDEGRLIRLVSPGRLIFAFGAVTFLVVVVQNVSVFGEALALLFPSRDTVSLSYRTSVWNAAFERIAENWLIGQGHTRFVSRLGWGVSHPHNFLLYYWLYGGIFAMLAVVTLWYQTLRKAYFERQRFVGRAFLSAIMMIFVMGVVEAPTEFPMLYGLTAIAYHIDLLEDTELERRHTLFKTHGLHVIW